MELPARLGRGFDNDADKVGSVQERRSRTYNGRGDNLGLRLIGQLAQCLSQLLLRDGLQELIGGSAS